MRRAGIVLLAALATGSAAAAQPSSGIVRPSDERGLPTRELGRQLYAGNCSSCHGSLARGIARRGPSLRGVGARALDFYLRTGRMPLGQPDAEPERERPPFDAREIEAIIDYVDSLGPKGPPVPVPRPESGESAYGLHLFADHCAGCHQIAGQGGVVTGARVPPLQDASATDIAEAVRTGPYLMPVFSSRQISDHQLDSIVRYVLSTRDPPDRGGWGIGHLGPIPEGMVAWLLAAFVLVAVCVALGKRSRS
jgi:ubiquinol-cytochrome c reductase cytochrome c subunit